MGKPNSWTGNPELPGDFDVQVSVPQDVQELMKDKRIRDFEAQQSSGAQDGSD